MPAKRCPMCHQANEDRAWQCRRCGYEFGQPVEKVQELLRGQLRSAHIVFWLFLLIDLGLAGAQVYLYEPWIPWPVPVTLFVVATSVMIRAVIRISISRNSLRALKGQQAELP